MRLGDFLYETEILESYLPNENLDIDLITNDSRQAIENSLYIAIQGNHWDGHIFIKEVLRKGASAAIVERIYPDIPIPQYRVANSRMAWSRLSAAFFDHPSRDMFVYSITATNGKTTIAFMLDEILRAHGLNTGIIGTVKIRMGDQVIPATMTTPECFELQRYFQKMRAAGVDTVTMESSSSALEQYRAADVRQDVLSFNNFSREHIDQHGTLEKYWMAKSSMITNSREDQITVINISDPEIRTLKGQGKGQMITYSVDGEDGDIFPLDIDSGGDNPQFTLRVQRDIVLSKRGGLTIPAQDIRIRLSVPGKHTVANAVACCAMALCQGIGAEAIQSGLQRFRGVERRFEMIYNEEFRIIDDHFANGSNIDASLLSLSGLDYRNLHIVYGIRGSRGVTVNRENVQALSHWLPKLRMDEIIVTESQGDVTFQDLVLPEERQVFYEEIEKTGLKVTSLREMGEALRYALEKVKPGDIILLAGTQGMDRAGRRILEYIAKERPEERDRILAPMKHRVCG